MIVGKLAADGLYLGLTRPPMLFGVSYMFAMLNFLGSIMYFVVTSSFASLFIFFPLAHILGYWLCNKEPLFVDLFILSRKCMCCKNRLFFDNRNSYGVA